MIEKNKLPENSETIEEHYDRVFHMLAGSPMLWLRFNGS